MAQAQARAEETPFEFHVPMGVETDATATEAEETETSQATDAGATPEQAEHITREEPDDGADPLESVRKKYNAQYSRKLEAERKRIREELMAELRGAEPEAPAREEAPREAAEAPEATDPFSELYRVDLEGFRPKLTYREDSIFSGSEDEVESLIGQYVHQAIQHTMKAVEANDKRFRERMSVQEREASAGRVLAEYLEEVKDHPDFADKWGELQKFGARTRQLAMEDPKEWIGLVESRFGLTRDWRGAEKAAQERAGRENERLAAKQRSVVERPTRALASGAGGGNGTWDSEITAAIRRLKK